MRRVGPYPLMAIFNGTLMLAPSSFRRCVGWKVFRNGYPVADPTGCRSCWSGIVVERWGQRRVCRSRSGPGHQHHMQLLAGGVGAECPDASSCQSTERIAVGTGRVAWIPRLVAGSAPADSPGAAEQATISAVHSAVRRTCPAGRQHLQQLLSGLGVRFSLSSPCQCTPPHDWAGCRRRAARPSPWRETSPPHRDGTVRNDVLRNGVSMSRVAADSAPRSNPGYPRIWHGLRSEVQKLPLTRTNTGARHWDRISSRSASPGRPSPACIRS